MSGYILVVWGAIVPLDVTSDTVAAEASDWYGPGLLHKHYTGNGEAPWYAGVALATIRQYSWPEKGYEIHAFEPTRAQRRAAEEAVAKLPESLRRLMTPIGRYVLPCP